MKILVTGAGGLIGSWAAAYYKGKGAEVVGVDNFERAHLLGHGGASATRMRYNHRRLDSLAIPIEELDISRPETMNRLGASYGRFDAILHLAAQCGVPPSIRYPYRDFQVNALGTLNVLEYARDVGASVVYASTNKVYPIHKGWKRAEGRWRWRDDEMHRHGWPVQGMNLPICSGTRTPYGVSKYTGDLYCQEYAQLYDMKVGVFRMSCILGEHQLSFEEQGWVTWFIIANLTGQEVRVFGDGMQVRDILHVSDVVRAYDAFLTSDIKHGVWNIGGGPTQAISINECLLAIQETTKKKFKQVNYEDWRPSDQKCYTSDIRPATRELKWRARVGVEEIYDGICDWVEANVSIFC